MSIFIITLMMLMVSACKKEMKAPVLADGDYLLYYVKGDGLGLVTQTYHANAESNEDLVRELLGKLMIQPANKTDQVTENKLTEPLLTAEKNITKPTSIEDYNKLNATVKGFSFTEENHLMINFDVDYYNEKGFIEVLHRASIVKTLTQINEIEFIVFNVNGQPLIDSNDKPVGLMTKEDFIDDIEMETIYTLTVFFANEDGTGLKQFDKVIYDSGNVSMEQLVIRQLIAGPTELGYTATIPDGTTLYKATTKDGICYVDFNKNFLNKISTITDEVAIYSVVNSLVELPNINKVQFMINGETKKTFSEGMAFDKLFERNLSLIEGSN